MMAAGDVRSVLDKCALKLNENTSHSEKFLSLQDGVAADFTSLTKTLYDLHKSHEPVDYNGSPLAQLVVDNFDEEQIWQELELQNTPVLRHFENVVSEAISDDTLTLLDDEEYVDDDDDDDEEEEQRENDDDQEEMVDDEAEEEEEESLSISNKEDEDGAGEFSDEESDTNFDIDSLEEREKRKNHSVRKDSKSKGPPSKVDDRFFKLSEMESFLDEMDKQEEKGDGENDDIDYFRDILSDEEDDLDLEEVLSAKNKKKQSNLKSSRNLKYKDFFDAVDTDPAEVASQSYDEHDSMEEMLEDEEEESEEEEEGDDDDDDKSILKDQDPVKPKKVKKRVTFDFSGDEDDEGEDVQDIFGGKKPSSAKPENQSSFEKRQEKMSKKIQELENSALAEKPWQLSGEVSAKARPENSILEEDVDFEQSSRHAPAITEETTLQLEDIIKQRIKDQVFDDVVRKVKPKEEVFEYKKRLTLDQEKSKLSLAEVYEQEYLKQNQQKTEEENPAHVEIQKLMDTLFLKLDALSNFSFTPKPPVPEVKVVSNMPSIAMEEVAPVSASDATLLAPEEIKEKNKAGDVLGDSEKTSTDKKRERRKKKKMKRLKIQEKERRLKLKEANKAGENKKASKAEMAENLRKVTKAGKATVLKDQGRDKALRSSQAFFSQLQDQVKSQIKTVKDQSSKKKKHKELSVSKLKL